MGTEPRCPFCTAALPVPPGDARLQVTCPGCGRFVSAGARGSAAATVFVALAAVGVLLGLGGVAAVLLARSGAPVKEQLEAVAAVASGADEEAPDPAAAARALPVDEVEIGKARLDLSRLDEATRQQVLAAPAQYLEAQAEAQRLQQELDARRGGEPAPAELPEPAPAPRTPRAKPKEKPRVEVTTRVMGTEGMASGVAQRLFEGAQAGFERCFERGRASCGNCVRGFGGTITVSGDQAGRVVAVEAGVGPHRTFGKVENAAALVFGECVEGELRALRYPASTVPFKATHHLLVRVRE